MYIPCSISVHKTYLCGYIFYTFVQTKMKYADKWKLRNKLVWWRANRACADLSFCWRGCHKRGRKDLKEKSREELFSPCSVCARCGFRAGVSSGKFAPDSPELTPPSTLLMAYVIHSGSACDWSAALSRPLPLARRHVTQSQGKSRGGVPVSGDGREKECFAGKKVGQALLLLD